MGVLVELYIVYELKQEVKRVFPVLYSSHQRCSIKKAVPKNFAIFTGKHLGWSLLLIELQAKRLQHSSKNIAKFLRTPILKNICEPLPLALFTLQRIKQIK